MSAINSPSSLFYYPVPVCRNLDTLKFLLIRICAYLHTHNFAQIFSYHQPFRCAVLRFNALRFLHFLSFACGARGCVAWCAGQRTHAHTYSYITVVYLF